MIHSIDLFTKWAKSPKHSVERLTEKKAVIYTRVSSKEQYDTNLSLDWQRKAIEEYAHRTGFEIVEYFGGIYESAKTDGRKEFQRMLDFARKNKKITHILVLFNRRCHPERIRRALRQPHAKAIHMQNQHLLPKPYETHPHPFPFPTFHFPFRPKLSRLPTYLPDAGIGRCGGR